MNAGDIAKVRKTLELTQYGLAALLGVHAMTVSKWERGVLEPSRFHQAILIEFGKAAVRPRIGSLAMQKLMTDGVAAALRMLLNAAAVGGDC